MSITQTLSLNVITKYIVWLGSYNPIQSQALQPPVIYLFGNFGSAKVAVHTLAVHKVERPKFEQVFGAIQTPAVQTPALYIVPEFEQCQSTRSNSSTHSNSDTAKVRRILPEIVYDYTLPFLETKFAVILDVGHR